MSQSPAARIADGPAPAVPTPTFPERLTKPFLLVSVTAAMWCATWGVSVAVPALRVLVPLGFAVAWAGARVAPALVIQALLAVCYLVPALFILSTVPFSAGSWLIWMAPLAGVMVATTSMSRWAMPAMLKLPLACWALTVAATWPIVLLREADFRWDRIHPATAWWVGLAAAATILGILFLDWLFATFPSAGVPDTAYRRRIVMPLVSGWLIAACVALYQMFADIAFLNPGPWAVLHRARGTMADANAFGVISAIWGPIVFAIAVEQWAGWRRLIGVLALPVSWLVVWASGSRSSLPLTVIGLGIIIVWSLRASGPSRVARVTAAVGLLAALAVAVTAASYFSGVDSPIARMQLHFAPRWSLAWVAETASRLSSRDGYGTLSVAAIREFPLVGVGVSAFHFLVPTYAWKVLHTYIPPDNAQNWFRHNLAELGVGGSFGWIAWTGCFVLLLALGRSKHEARFKTSVLRGVLIAFGLISLVGIPAQDIPVTFTFWVLTFWFLTLLEPGHDGISLWRPMRPAWWLAAWIVVVFHAVATAYVGWTDLRPPFRAAAADLDFSYGFYPPEPGATVRWARKNAVEAIPVPAGRRWLRVTFFVQHVDLPKKPVDVKVWANRQLLAETRFTAIEPVTRYFKIPEGDKRVVLETWVSRSVRPRDFGVPDDRELGLLVDWQFVDAPPPGYAP